MKRIVLISVFLTLLAIIVVEGSSNSGNDTDRVLQILEQTTLKDLKDIRIDLQPVGRFLRWINENRADVSNVGTSRIIFRVLFQEKMMYLAMFVMGAMVMMSAGGLFMGTQGVGLGMGIMGVNMAMLLYRLFNGRNGNGNGNGGNGGNGNGGNGNGLNGMMTLGNGMGLINRMGTGNGLMTPMLLNGLTNGLGNGLINGITLRTTDNPPTVTVNTVNTPTMLMLTNGNGQTGQVIPLFNAANNLLGGSNTPTINRIDNLGNVIGLTRIR